MKNIFNELIDSYIDTKIGITEHFLNDALAKHLKENLNILYAKKQLLYAGTGNEKLVLHDKLVRSDAIYWLDRKHNDTYENEFFDLIDEFVSHLNSTCYTGITGYEFHYAVYEE